MIDIEAEVSLRLRAVMIAFQIDSNPAMAEICGTNRSVVSNWLLSYNLPRVPEMIRLCERTGITLDWIYRGADHAMGEKLNNELRNIMSEARARRPAA